MSETTASLRRKIKSAGDLQSVVRTMKALAASSIGQYERSVRALADYYRAVELGLSVYSRLAEPLDAPPGPRPRSVERTVGAIVFGSDQGLVGPFNEVVVEHAVRALAAVPGRAEVWAVGERVRERLVDARLPLLEVFPVPSSVQAIAPLVAELLVRSETRQSQGEEIEVHVFHNQPTSRGIYTPVGQRLLPLDEQWRRSLSEVPWPTKNPPEILGGTTRTLRALIREYLFISLFRACAESLASENTSRLAAMERADNNIDELLEGLQGSFHQLRQSTIDEELFDVISGFEALSEEPSPRRKTRPFRPRDPASS